MQKDQEASVTQAAALNLRAEEAESQVRLLESELTQVQVQAAEVSCWFASSAPNQIWTHATILLTCPLKRSWVPGQCTAGVAAAGCPCCTAAAMSQSDPIVDFCI